MNGNDMVNQTAIEDGAAPGGFRECVEREETGRETPRETGGRNGGGERDGQHLSCGQRPADPPVAGKPSLTLETRQQGLIGEATGFRLDVGDVRAVLQGYPDESVQCVITSPPYWQLRDYGIDGQLGLEETPAEFIAMMVQVFTEVRRVLKKDGVCFVNMGDCYVGQNNTSIGGNQNRVNQKRNSHSDSHLRFDHQINGLPAKNMMGMPWRLAFALQDDGWILRQDIIWNKPNPMPESCKDRCTKAHEYVFLFAKSQRYYWDFEAMQEPVTGNANPRGNGVNRKISGWAEGPGNHNTIEHCKPGGKYKGSVPGRKGPGQDRRSPKPRQNKSFSESVTGLVENRNKRSVWTIPTKAYAEAHFATYPPDLVKPCVMAGSRPGDVVLDPFGGSGTTAAVALELGRKAVTIELNPEYADLIRQRVSNVTPGFGF